MASPCRHRNSGSTPIPEAAVLECTSAGSLTWSAGRSHRIDVLFVRRRRGNCRAGDSHRVGRSRLEVEVDPRTAFPCACSDRPCTRAMAVLREVGRRGTQQQQRKPPGGMRIELSSTLRCVIADQNIHFSRPPGLGLAIVSASAAFLQLGIRPEVLEKARHQRRYQQPPVAGIDQHAQVSGTVHGSGAKRERTASTSCSSR